MVVDTITYAKTHLSAIIEKVLEGEEVILKRAGKPVAVIHPYCETTAPRRPGALRGSIKIEDDFEELPEDIAKAFGVEE
ncbi:MAG: type II toxin-antitoxin system Phd/YefM family antitoxin [Spirochaeta sp.]